MKELISFDWYGKMAHFRKFYSNASALSHTIPPRTTVLGLLAAIVGLPRDSYYQNTEGSDFDNNLIIGVQLLNPVKKINQKLNYLKIEKLDIDEFTGMGNRKQISTEFLIPHDIKKMDSCIKYRIYVGMENVDYEHFITLKQNLENHFHPFGISLGAANLIGYIDNYQCSVPFQATNPTTDYLNIITAIRETFVEKINRSEKDFVIEHDLMPSRFAQTLNNNTASKEEKAASRMASQTDVMLYSVDEKPLTLHLKKFENIHFLSESKTYIALI